jgi:host factor-I protein
MKTTRGAPNADLPAKRARPEESVAEKGVVPLSGQPDMGRTSDERELATTVERGPRPGGAKGAGSGQKMAGERSQNLQDTFLNHVRKNKVPLTIFLINGVKLQGIVTWFDNFCVLLRRDGHSQLVYKHAISTIMPGHPIQMFEPGEEAAADK